MREELPAFRSPNHEIMHAGSVQVSKQRDHAFWSVDISILRDSACWQHLSLQSARPCMLPALRSPNHEIMHAGSVQISKIMHVSRTEISWPWDSACCQRAFRSSNGDTSVQISNPRGPACCYSWRHSVLQHTSDFLRALLLVWNFMSVKW